jgi:hypothetical protein
MGITKLFAGFLLLGLIISSPAVFADLPNTTNYKLNSYGFGSGGTANSGTANYSLEGITGEVSGQSANTTNYTTKPGFVESQQANVPKVTITNPSNYYDKLKFVIDEQNNPSDAKYALQIRTANSNFDSDPSNNKYVKSDYTVGTTLTTADYQTYAVWGGATGHNIIGLSSSTTYYIRAKATQGQFTESGYGPSSNVATVGQQISFCVYTTSCGSGASVAFNSLVAGNISNGSNNIGVNFATNANSGGSVYIYSANGGLRSTHTSSTLTSATADLSVAASGYGAQITSFSQLTKVSPYNNSSNSVGILSTNVNTILTSSAPVTAGTGSIQLQAKPSNTTPAANDYADTLTLIAAAAF